MSDKHPLYLNRKFGDYEFQEYPKWVHFEGKPSVLINNSEEESALCDKTFADQSSDLSADESETDVLETLRARADELGVKWRRLGLSEEELRKKIDEHLGD